MNKCKLYLLALYSCCAAGFATAQTPRAEYWIDQDPGRGNATALTVTSNPLSADIPTGSLSTGWHTVGLRVQQGKWSQTYTRLFYKADGPAEASRLSGAEYWIDKDPGRGNAFPITFADGQVSFALTIKQTDTLATGWHVMGARVRYDDTWSQTYTHLFVRIEVSPSAAVQVESIEAYWDEDTAHKVSVPFLQEGGVAVVEGYDFDTENLSLGTHYLYLVATAGGYTTVYVHEIVIQAADPTAVENTVPEPGAPRKLIHNGKVYIFKGTKVYTLQGTVVQ